MNMTQGCIHFFDLSTAVELIDAILPNLETACNMDKDEMKMRVGTPKSQSCQLSRMGFLT